MADFIDSKGVIEMKNIPLEIVNLAVEAISDQNDGWTKQGARDRLIEIRDYINNVLGETYTCARCGRELIVRQYLDYVNLPEGKVCMPCVGGS